MYDHYFSNFSRRQVSDDICKGSAIRNPRFWKTRRLKVVSHTNAMGSKLDLAVKRSNVNTRHLF